MHGKCFPPRETALLLLLLAPSTFLVEIFKKFITSTMCFSLVTQRKRPSIGHLMGLSSKRQMSARTKAGYKWLSKIKKGAAVGPKDSVALSVVHLSPMGSTLSFANTTRIEHVADWDAISKKYRILMGELQEERGGGGEDEEEEGGGDNGGGENGGGAAAGENGA